MLVNAHKNADAKEAMTPMVTTAATRSVRVDC
jgi:hypothetical protein